MGRLMNNVIGPGVGIIGNSMSKNKQSSQPPPQSNSYGGGGGPSQGPGGYPPRQDDYGPGPGGYPPRQGDYGPPRGGGYDAPPPGPPPGRYDSPSSYGRGGGYDMPPPGPPPRRYDGGQQPYSSAYSGQAPMDSKDRMYREDQERGAPDAYNPAPPSYGHGGHGYDDSDEDSDDVDQDAAYRQADQAQSQFVRPEDAQTQQQLSQGSGIDRYVSDTVRRYPMRQRPQRLSMPVIIPQRRPQDQSSGFIRAYAPILEYSDVSQDAFLHFLDGFQAVVRNDPKYSAVNMATTVTGVANFASNFIPSMIAGYVIPAVDGATRAGRHAFENNLVNQYIDKMNTDFFKPRDLYAIIMAYKPEEAAAAKKGGLIGGMINSVSSQGKNANRPQDMQGNLMAAIAQRDTGQANNFRGSSGSTTELQIPESAPLVFPELDAAPEAQQKGAFASFGADSRDYMDRRARAQWAAANPNSRLAQLEGPQQFGNAAADPNSAASSGGLKGMLSGGMLGNDKSGKDERKQAKRDRKDRDKRDKKKKKGKGSDSSDDDYDYNARGGYGGGPAQGGYGQPGYGQRGMDPTDPRMDPAYQASSGGGRRDRKDKKDRKQKKQRGGLRRQISPDVIYLMILPYPSKDEMSAYQASQGQGGGAAMPSSQNAGYGRQDYGSSYNQGGYSSGGGYGSAPSAGYSQGYGPEGRSPAGYGPSQGYQPPSRPPPGRW